VRVGYVGPVPPHRGGVAQHGKQVVNALRSEGHEVAVESWRSLYPRLLFRGVLPDVNATSSEGVSFRLSWWNPISWWSTGRRLKSVDMMVFPWVTPVHGLPLLVMLRVARPPSAVAIVHNAKPHERMPLARSLFRWVIGRCVGVVVHSEDAVQQVMGQVDQLDVQVVEHPPNLVVCRCPFPSRPPLRLLFLGFVREYKGVDLAIEAVAIGRDTGLNLRLTVAGEFWESVSVYESVLTRLGVEDCVELRPGYVEDTEVDRLLSQHHIVVLPYRTATASGVVPLALSAGRPVVTTPVGGLPEIIRNGENGAVATEVSAKALLEAVERVGNDLDRLGDGAAENVAKWSDVAGAILAAGGFVAD